MAKTTYYLIRERAIGKREGDELQARDYLFKEGKWEPDRDSVIKDHLIGYDPSEPEGSPYWCGNTSIMDEMTEIPEERAFRLMGEQVVSILTEKWKVSFAEEKKAWDADPRWPAKLVKTECTLFGVEYTILPEDIGLTDGCWDQGFMECIQSELKRDLIEYGADSDRVYNLGFID